MRGVCADTTAPRRWFPFAEGPRNCVGKSLANVTLPATLAIMLSRFTFRLADEVPPAMFSAHGAQLRKAAHSQSMDRTSA